MMSESDSFNLRSFMNLTVRLRTSLARYPSLTFEGITPSASMNARHLVWSAITYTASIGSAAFVSSSTDIPSLFATLDLRTLRSAMSSMSIIPAIFAFSPRSSWSSSTPEMSFN